MRQRRIYSLAFLLFACLLAFPQAGKASTGWIYSYGALVQNKLTGQFYVNVYDYGASKASGFYFNSSSGSFKSATIDKIVYTLTGTACTEVVLTGQGSFFPPVSTGSLSTKGVYTLHIWKGIVNGITATWVQARLQTTETPPFLLWATGSVWPAVESTPIKAAGCILQAYKG